MPKVINHDEMRGYILKESHRIFGEKGYQSISMRFLAKNIGVTTGVLYHYFDSKESLVQALLNMGLEQSLMASDSKPIFQKMGRDQPIEERIRMLFLLMDENDDTAITNIMLLSDYFRDLQTSEAVDKNYHVAYKFFLAFRDSIGLEAKDNDLARLVLTYLVGMHTVRMWTAKKTSIKEFCAIFFKYFK